MSNNAEILAKVIMDIKAILDIEKVLTDELNCVGKSRNPGLVEDLLLVMDKADAVRAAQRIQAGYSGLKVVKQENEVA
ncbi:hypothetical protein Nham_3314 [Nitrobacter hamburgensis X14]|uniref:Uncharacterized protein n=1 Tax=Nitrobacter hamburgensis (strain DSM 10229 / NCIMB 13809 / X14) TaxID=323097 RepID=Q1QIA1_NITHX|nr:hypothetical protein [Nitrobacter hamburgensis]ABE64046.1 hypothetical protein Nham_3314 [Nitrobacter hamburgensis X14]